MKPSSARSSSTPFRASMASIHPATRYLNREPPHTCSADAAAGQEDQPPAPDPLARDLRSNWAKDKSTLRVRRPMLVSATSFTAGPTTVKSSRSVAPTLP
jgi:hypothetical protein